MPFKTETSEFNNVFGKEATMTVQFLEKLTDYLETRKMVSPFSDIYERVVHKKPLSAFACRNDIALDMTELLSERQISCIRVVAPNGKTGFVTSSDDDDGVKSIQSELLKRKSRFLPVYTGKMLRSMIDGEKTQSVLSLSGLTRDEIYLLRNLCENNGGLSACGIDEMEDGTFKFSVFSGEAIKPGVKGLSLPQIYIQVQMMLSGPYSDLVTQRIERQARFEDLLAEDYSIHTQNNDRPIIILGEAQEFVRISRDGMEHGYVEMNDGEYHFSVDKELRSTLPDYSLKISAYACRLVNPVVIKDPHDLSSALNHPSISVSNRELHDTMGQKAFFAKIAELLEQKKEYDPTLIQAGAYDEKFQRLLEKTKFLLAASVTGNYPSEYTEKEQTELEKLKEQVGLSLAPYKEVIRTLSSVEVQTETKDIKKLRSLNEVNIAAPEQNKEKKAPGRSALGIV